MASRITRPDAFTPVTQSQTPPPSSRGLLSAEPSPSCPRQRGEKGDDNDDDDEEEGLSDSSDCDSDDKDRLDHLNGDDDNDDDKNNNNNNRNAQDHHRNYCPPLHIPDIPWRPDLLPPAGIFPPSHFLTDENWELWHNNWLSILLANGVPTTANNTTHSSSSSNRFLLSIRDDYLLGAYMRMTMTPEVLRGNPRCENQLVEFVSARELWRWLPATLGDFSTAGSRGGAGNDEGAGGGGAIRIVRADQPWRIRGRTWTRFGRVVDVEALKEGERYDR